VSEEEPGLDGHDRGAIIVAMGLRDEGMEVIYTGIRNSVESIVQTCLQEGIDVLGLSTLSGGHTYYFPKIIELLKEKGMDEVLVIGGGIIPKEDIAFLKERGVKEIFTPGSSIKEIANFIKKNVKRSSK